eukprot:CAMPEP_0117081978 /NCGR_PEP_ID=MMETSP0472-20121206/57756_1 /TAXON_ID=693140 ORGANISM="Tiarina fusus, Strain LIS" /NCGR_SAMPLE_ID=MMETSP0472 /ASSEMBLY_ACC=CAM_ASM_000603 /LENGTH=118 /DNA_ID=CAMNT_0004810083 /DNA_START=124 /DNA_END=481 /DNA_ORIENTATION=-
MSSDLRACSKFCAGFSVLGALFMLMVAMMLTYQPLFIGGIDDVQLATDSAYGGMAAYIFSFLLSVVFLIKDAISPDSDSPRRNRNGNEYSGVPQSGGVLNEYALNLDLPPSVEEGVFS